jgi:hypothetical protein
MEAQTVSCQRLAYFRHHLKALYFYLNSVLVAAKTREMARAERGDRLWFAVFPVQRKERSRKTRSEVV